MASGGWWWPSLGWPSLPGLDSFTARHWQRRLLRYVIKRTLTGFLKIPEDDVEHSTYLDADLGSGSVKLHDVELDQEAVNQMLSKQLGHDFPLSVCLQSGGISSVQILVGSSETVGHNDHERNQAEPSRHISATERLFTAPIHVTARDLLLDFRIQPAVHEPEVSEDSGEHETDSAIDLGASILHIAEEYVHEDSPELEDPAHGDYQPFGLPGGFESSSSNTLPQSALSEQQQVGLVASIIETLLGRLRLTVRNIIVNLRFGSDVHLQLRVARLQTSTEAKTSESMRVLVRSLDISGFDIYAISTESHPSDIPVSESPRGGDDRDSRASSVSTGSSDDLAMSMAIADLRTSETLHSKEKEDHLITPSTASSVNEQSVYEDAESYADTQSSQVTTGVRAENKLSVSDCELHKQRDDVRQPGRHILGVFQAENDCIRPARISVRVVRNTTSLPSIAVNVLRDGPTKQPPSTSSVRIEIKLPLVALSLDTPLLESASSFLASLAAKSSRQSAITKAKEERDLPSISNTLLHLQMQALRVFGHLHSDPEELSHLVQKVTHMNTGPLARMLYVYLQKIEGVYRLDGQDAKVAIHDFGLCFAHNGSLRPLLLPDPGLLWQYDADALSAGELQIPLHNPWPTATHPVLSDWLCSLPITANSLTASTHLPMLQDAFAARRNTGLVTINMQPIHVWVDVEAVDELLHDILTSAAVDAYVSISEEDALFQPTNSHPEEERAALFVTMPCIRFDIRCPTLSTGNKASYGELRGGILSLALHDVTYVTAKAEESTAPGQRAQSLGLEVPHFLAFLTKVPGAEMRKVFYAGKGPLSPSMAIKLHSDKSVRHRHVGYALHVRVPSIEIVLEKSDIDAIQYLADDLTRVTGRVAVLSEMVTAALKQRRALSTRPSARQSLPDSWCGASLKSDVKLSDLQFLIEDTQISLWLHSSEKNRRSLKTVGSALSITVGLRHSAKDDLNVKISLNDIKTVDRISSEANLRQTGLLWHNIDADTPALTLQLASSLTGKHKSTKVSLHLSCLTFNLPPETSLVDDLVSFVKLPPGEFLDVIPTDVTAIKLHANEITVKLVPRNITSNLALFCGQLKLATRLKYGAVGTRYKVSAYNVQAWAADDLRMDETGRGTFKEMGYAQLVQCQNAAATIETISVPISVIKIVVDIEQAHFTACPDTLLCVTAFADDFRPTKVVPRVASRQTSAAMSESVILPRAPVQSFQKEENLSSTQSMLEVVSAVDGDTIEIANQAKIQVDQHWLHSVVPSASDLPDSKSPTFHLIIRPTQVTISLFEGYDFDRTRGFVKSAVKATRRKLEKIKQLLAEGQMPEQTIEEVADPLLQSVFLPPRRDRRTRSNVRTEQTEASAEEMDAMARIVAFDDELDQDEDEQPDSLLAWETLTDRPAAPRRGSSSSFRTAPMRSVRPSRLRRPRNSAIDIHLSDLECSMQSFGPDQLSASRLHVRVGDFSIVDNIRTSTWNKFLTELRPRDGGIIRPTGTPMVRIVLRMLRTGDAVDSTEADLSVRVAPLRLHVDQDALDFFKTFFAFKMDPLIPSSDKPLVSSTRHPPQGSRSEEGAFIQRVEIAAVKIKLDYKPKRVDYHALRQGRAIEMMNFFHFEASEMVLRHLVLSGVPSWAKVGDMLQEIWTPDVKANQLADFLAGINPVRSVVNVGYGVADLVLLPVAQYQKDGRLTRGLQRGSSRFAKSTAMEAIKLGARLATGTQVILEHAERVLGGRIETSSNDSRPSPTSRLSDVPTRSEWLLTATDESVDDEETEARGTEAYSKFSQQPEDVKIGLQTAYKSLSGNVRSAAETILAVPMEVYERSNDGPVRAVVRAVPIAVLKPMIGASEAVSKTLLGLRNTLDPGAKEEVQDKYKGRSHAE